VARDLMFVVCLYLFPKKMILSETMLSRITRNIQASRWALLMKSLVVETTLQIY